MGSGGATSAYDRRNQQATALRVIEHYPLAGVGWNKYPEAGEPYFQASKDYPLTGATNGRIQVVHNVLLSNTAELASRGSWSGSPRSRSRSERRCACAGRRSCTTGSSR